MLDGREISIVFQGAMNALNPVYKVGEQISEAILLHEPNVTKKEAMERTAKFLELVNIDLERADNYPQEFSGGCAKGNDCYDFGLQPGTLNKRRACNRLRCHCCGVSA